MAERVVVTGADGFIGSHLVEALVREGRAVRALAMYNSFGTAGWLDRIDPAVRSSVEIVLGDVRDTAAMESLLEGCDSVFHLAALIGIPYSYRAPESYVDTNVKGTLNVLQAARLHDVAKFVHTSTSEVYGTAETVPISERHPLKGQSPYSASKIGADQMAMSFHASFGLPVITVRPFNTYGPRQSARAIIPTVITQLAAGAAVLRLGSLHPTRDFTFVHDTVLGFLAAEKEPRLVGQVVNVGSGFEISIGDLVRVIAELMGAAPEIERDEVRVRPEQSEVDRLLADNEKARTLMHWKPEFEGEEGLRRGLERTIEWFTSVDERRPDRSAEYSI